ncbi:amidohydrolase family protein [Sphingomicrobium sp. XHP0239]|uniref:amidohydrolase family protein n=1 Tax=Sphingomicrobium maritimum TaxID=3133972 RepID=UPI0031CCD571
MFRTALAYIALFVGAPAAAQEARLFTDVRILTMDEDVGVIERGWVHVENGRIAAMGSGTPSPDQAAGIQRIEGSGTTLMPGLHDMHVHYWRGSQGLSYLLNGITSVRNMTGSTSDALLSQGAADGAILGPRVTGPGPLMDGDPPVRSGISLVLTSPEQAVGAVRAQATAYFPAIKLYERLDAETFRAAVAEAKRLDLKIYAHTPDSLTVEEMLDLGIDSLEHLDGLSEVLVDKERLGDRSGSVAEWAEAEPARFPEWVGRVKDSGVTGVPTLALSYGRRDARDEGDAWYDRPELAIFSENDVAWWRSSIAEGGFVSRSFPDLDAAIANKVSFVSALREAGVPLLIGTDPPNPFVLSGYAIHDEFRGFLDAGYTAEEVMRIATRDAALFSGREDLGIVRSEARADLLLVDGDPRSDITVLRRPRGVMVAGHWYDRTALDTAFADRAAQIASPATAIASDD